jgi:hypothetical protein
MNNFSNLLKIQNLKNQIKVYKELILHLETITLSYGYSNIPVIGSLGAFSCDLLKEVQEFFNQIKFLNDKPDYDSVNSTLIEIKDLLKAFIDKGNDLLIILKKLKNLFIEIYVSNGTSNTKFNEVNSIVNNLQFNFDASKNCFSINTDRKCNPYVGGEINDILFEFLISPDKNSEVCGYDASLNKLLIKNADLDLSYNVIYSNPDIDNRFNVDLNTINIDKLTNFLSIVSNELNNIDSYININNTDKDKTAADYNTYKTELVKKLNNKVNSLKLEISLRGYDTDKYIPFLGV